MKIYNTNSRKNQNNNTGQKSLSLEKHFWDTFEFFKWIKSDCKSINIDVTSYSVL